MRPGQPASRRSWSAVVFNALVIVALIPLALRGVPLPRRLGGVGAAPQPARVRRSAALIVPFIGIKLIDVVVAGLGIV